MPVATNTNIDTTGWDPRTREFLKERPIPPDGCYRDEIEWWKRTFPSAYGTLEMPYLMHVAREYMDCGRVFGEEGRRDAPDPQLSRKYLEKARTVYQLLDEMEGHTLHCRSWQIADCDRMIAGLNRRQQEQSKRPQ